MRVLLLSRYARLGASSRLRSYQYLPFLERQGVEVTVAPLFDDDYVRGLYSGRISKLDVIRGYLSRLETASRANNYDLVWLEYEILPWLPAWIELRLLPEGIPLVVDYDDAVFHRYDQHPSGAVRALLGHKIDAVMRRADLVVAGNAYLGEHAASAGARRVEFLPTVVDAARYKVPEEQESQAVTIGWIGSPTTARYMELVAPALQAMVESHRARVVAIGAHPAQLRGLPIEVRPWSEETEVAEIQGFDIGIMPLSDNRWESGKCGYKLIQYMACGRPVVASPVGANRSIVLHGENGFLAQTESQWRESLETLIGSAALRKKMGAAGRKTMEREYSLQVAAPRLARLLRSVVTTPCAA